MYLPLVTFHVWLKKIIVRCSFHMVAEPRSEGALDATPSSDGLVPESSLASEEEQELTEIDILKKLLEESKAAGKDERDHSGLDQDHGAFPREGKTPIKVVRKAACQNLRDSTRKT